VSCTPFGSTWPQPLQGQAVIGCDWSYIVSYFVAPCCIMLHQQGGFRCWVRRTHQLGLGPEKRRKASNFVKFGLVRAPIGGCPKFCCTLLHRRGAKHVPRSENFRIGRAVRPGVASLWLASGSATMTANRSMSGTRSFLGLVHCSRRARSKTLVSRLPRLERLDRDLASRSGSPNLDNRNQPLPLSTALGCRVAANVQTFRGASCGRLACVVVFNGRFTVPTPRKLFSSASSPGA
jgi:hypothetical protein